MGAPTPSAPADEAAPPRVRAARWRWVLATVLAAAVLGSLAVWKIVVDRVPDLPAPAARWHVESDLYVTAPAVADAERVYVPTESGIFRFSLGNGSTFGPLPVAVPNDLALALGGGVVYAVATDGALYAVDVNTGAQVWEPVRDSRPFATSPIFQDGQIYVGSEGGEMHVLTRRPVRLGGASMLGPL